MNIKRIFIAMVALVPAIAFAGEASDTTLTVNNKKIVIAQDGEQTSVKIYKQNGEELTKTSETQFVDGQEVEKIYVSSPFIPKTWSTRHYRKLYSHYPDIYFGCSMLPSSKGSFGNDNMHCRDTKSWEWGLKMTSLSFTLNDKLALTSSLLIGQVHHHFKDNYVLSTNSDGQTEMIQKEGESVKKSYISYYSLRLPIMLEYQKRIAKNDFYFAVGASLEYRRDESSRYYTGKKKHTETHNFNLNPFGVNMEAFVGYGCIMLYTRIATTPLLKKSKAPECYPLSLGLGFRL